MTADMLALAEWLAAARVHPRGDGEHGGVLAADLEPAGGPLHPAVGQRPACQGRPRAQDRRERREWLADLLRHGLLRGSFVPDREQRELRELTRYRTALLRERAAVANRLQKTLEAANLKLASVATDITGKSGRAILRALIAGETEPTRLAALAARTIAGEDPPTGAGAGRPVRSRTSASWWRSTSTTSTSWMGASRR